MPSVSYLALTGRVMMAVIYLVSSVEKFLTPTETQAYIAQHLPNSIAVYWIGAFVELFGGLSLLTGVGVRFGALVLALFTFAAAVFFHTNFADHNQLLHFLKNLAIAGGLLQAVAFGSGRRHT